MSEAPITFLVPGYPSGGEARGASGSRPADDTRRGTLKQSVTVAARRGEGGEVTLTATPGRDVVVLHIQDGPSLTLHPANARDLLLAQSGFAPNRSGGTVADGGVRVPASLRWRGIEQTVPARGASRGRLGEVLLRGIDVVQDAVTDLLFDQAQSFAASELVTRVDAQVNEGVYALNPDTLTPLKTAASLTSIPGGAAKLLVFIHGTFSTTSGTFGRLWTKHPDRVRQLFDRYSQQVYALDHRTLGVSPLSNALTLARALPEGAHVHLVTHSRGGLVGEALARACATGSDGQEFFSGDGYEQHRKDLKDLLDVVRAQKITVDRFVRVACPVRGTLLASKRVDAYLSILKWTLDLAGLPVVAAVVDFLNGVAQHRASPEDIPGLAAQVPDSPVVQWLHHVALPLAGELRVVAGDVEGDSITSWLKTLLADAFYWTDNDFVVQTGSMYGGTPRQLRSTFLLNQGGKVSHFTYFDHQKTADAIVDALIEDQPQGFRPIGKESYAGRDSSGIRAHLLADSAATPSAAKPAVILVPGVFGSHLRDERGRIWLDWEAIDPLTRLNYKAAGITPDGLVEGLFGKLETALSATHDVIAFPYDWRQPIEQSAKGLAARLAEALRARDESGQPVRILAHSTGGLVARTLQLDHGDVWQQWLSHPDARLLMLGTPNAGLWAPMQLLSGDDTLGGALTFFSTPSRDRDARRTLAEFPGLMQLQAGLLDQLSLRDPRTWNLLAGGDERRASEASSWHATDVQKSQLGWGLPDEQTLKALLDSAVALQERLANQAATDFGPFLSKICLVTGKAALTPYGYTDGDEGFAYLYTPSGDGYVTFGSAALPGVKAWAADGGHDGLPSRATAFDAYIELLQKGTTTRLPLAAAVASTGDTRGAPSTSRETIRLRPARTPKSLMPPAAIANLLGATDQDAESTTDPTTLQVTIVNGDLAFVHQPVMLGHYRSSKLTGTERVMNDLIGGAMAASLKKGLYPDLTGSHQIFLNTRPHVGQLPRPEAVIVVGLGEEGKLRAADLIATVRNGVLGWAQRLSERGGTAQTFELAATLIASGGIDMSAGQAADLIVQGVCQANEQLAAERDSTDERDPARPWPQANRLYLIELYLERASEAWRALRMTPGLSSRRYVLTEFVETGQGGLPRPLDSQYRGTDYDFIRAETRDGSQGLSIAYTLDTKRRARSEVRPQPIQRALISNLVERGADDRNSDAQIGRTLFRLLVPVDLEPFLTGDCDTQLEVDAGTAGIPWELLDTASVASNDTRPWAIRTKLMRKLKTAEFRGQVTDAGLEAGALIIGEPLCDAKLYPRLPGAVAEANAVAETLEKTMTTNSVRLLAENTKGGTRPDADTVIKTLLTGAWRIVHIAGHGEPPELFDAKPSKPGESLQAGGNPRGVVLSNAVYLGSLEINSMRTVPELVFVNCCYLAKRSSSDLLTPEQAACADRFASYRPSFASGLADALIKVGVRCVIAAGWAVDDGPARIFAVRFYEALIDGMRFIDAVALAREAAAREPNSNTWGAYQCYGDPDWTLRKPEDHATTPSAHDGLEEFSVIASPLGLVLALETIVVRIKHQNRNISKQRRHIQWLEDKFGARWGNQGSVAEAFGHAWAEAGNRKAAQRWYRSALGANDGGASLRCAEQLANTDVRLAWGMASAADQQYRETSARPAPVSARTARDEALADARRQVTRGIALLETLVSVERSMERESLLGSAYKRLALIEAIAHDDADGPTKEETDALAMMQRCYRRAEDFGREHKLNGFYYPALNRLAADLVLRGTGEERLDQTELDAIREDLDKAVADRPEFWNVVSQTELRVYEALDRSALGAALPHAIEAYNDLQRRIGQPWMWASVYDQAQFVLTAYKKHASQEERESADLLLQHLKTLRS